MQSAAINPTNPSNSIQTFNIDKPQQGQYGTGIDGLFMLITTFRLCSCLGVTLLKETSHGEEHRHVHDGTGASGRRVELTQVHEYNGGRGADTAYRTKR